MNTKNISLRMVLFVLAYLINHSTLAYQTLRNNISLSPSVTSYHVNSSPKCRTAPCFFQNNFRPGKFVFQLGGFKSVQGEAQNIGIQSLIGDRFTVKKDTDDNVLVGLGYYMDGLTQNCFSLMYGLNAFYLAQATVKGNVVQEQMFTNLSYQYSITNYPIYLATKIILMNPNCGYYNFTFDLGIGPNIIQTSNVREHSLDGVTVPDNTFSGNTNVAFSATAGVGIRFNNVFRCIPLEVGYRYFYLGEGDFHKNTNQLTNTLKTGNNYANALVISVSV